MKRVFVIAVLAVLLLATAGATTAVAANKKTIVTKNLYVGTDNGALKPVGTVTFDTITGDWAITQKQALLPNYQVGYYIAITDSPTAHHKYSPTLQVSEVITTDANGMLPMSGPLCSNTAMSDVNACLANGGVFVISINSV